jgi:hypothetical protein
MASSQQAEEPATPGPADLTSTNQAFVARLLADAGLQPHPDELLILATMYPTLRAGTNALYRVDVGKGI